MSNSPQSHSPAPPPLTSPDNSILPQQNRVHPEIDGTGQPPPCPGETRCFHVSPEMLEMEQELLLISGAQSYGQVLRKVHNYIDTTVALMENTNMNAKVPGLTLQMVGEHLQTPLELLERVWSLLNEMKLVSVVRVK